MAIYASVKKTPTKKKKTEEQEEEKEGKERTGTRRTRREAEVGHINKEASCFARCVNKE